jgi:hypothetical protein
MVCLLSPLPFRKTHWAATTADSDEWIILNGKMAVMK